MTDIARAHRQALYATGAIIDKIGADQLGAATPCADWNVRDLLNHVVSGNWWAAELANGLTIEQVGTRFEGDVIGSDPSDPYRRSAEAAAAAFERPGALDSPCAVSYGPVPGSVYAGHRFIDVFVHGWDLAVATSQDSTLDPELCEECWAIVEPQAEILRASGMFGDDRRQAVQHEDPQKRLIAFLGRETPS